MRPLFQLGPRLALCAEFAREGARLCDIGTDHAYLPIWLLKSGKITVALAADINAGPLETAAQNAARYHVQQQLQLRQSDGLREILPEECDDVVIAGMGGELILRMVQETPWLQEEQIQLILQPMSGAKELREGLLALGFVILQERAVEDAGRVYTVMSVRYSGAMELPEKTELLYPYLGALQLNTTEAKEYATRLLRHLNGQLQGALRGRGEESTEKLQAVIAELSKRLKPGGEQ